MGDLNNIPMATDGVKIIDGDLAHDTFSTIIDKFERGISVEQIKQEEKTNYQYIDDFDHEIFITSYALALWEIGHLDKKTLNEVKNVIGKGACVKRWAEWDTSLGKARVKVLERFITKISSPKKNPKKVKKFKPIQNVIFEEGEVVAFKIGHAYYISVIAIVQKIRNYCIYTFGITDLQFKTLPTIIEIIKSNILMSKIGCWESEESINQRQPGLKDFFGSLDHEFNSKFFIGLTAINVEHKKLNKFLTNFVKLGKIKLIDGYKFRGGGSFDVSFEEFSFSFKNFIDNYEIIKFNKIPLSIIMENT